MKHSRAGAGHRLAAITVATILVVGGLGASPAASQTSTSNIRSDADWILSAQLPDGAIANYVDRKAIWPYLSNFAAMGLARATETTGNRKYVDAAWRWLAWYQAHMDAQGFVTDHVVQNGIPVSTGFMDSTDSYAATFLLATRMAYRARPDRALLNSLRPGIASAVRAIEATQDTDGLTWAKPDWRVKYLMDQAETYAGLLAGIDLATVLGDAALASRAKTDADRMRAGVDALWNGTVSAYDWAKHDGGGRTANSWSILYSDSLQQAWAVAFGMVTPVRATALMAKFNTSQPKWALPNATAQFSGGTAQSVGYWPVASLGFSLLSNPLGATSATTIRSASITNNRAWPFTTGNAGQLILLQSYSGATSMIARLPVTLLNGVISLIGPTTTTTKAPVAILAAAAPSTNSTPEGTAMPTSSPNTTSNAAGATSTTTPLVPKVQPTASSPALVTLQLGDLLAQLSLAPASVVVKDGGGQ